MQVGIDRSRWQHSETLQLQENMAYEAVCKGQPRHQHLETQENMAYEAVSKGLHSQTGTLELQTYEEIDLQRHSVTLELQQNVAYDGFGNCRQQRALELQRNVAYDGFGNCQRAQNNLDGAHRQGQQHSEIPIYEAIS